ncbi:hypothetical protein [Pseudomonas phage Pae01]|uniref:Uncharacterized protein n=1 Tax=Pseudomonas phage vB_PaeM_LCK69 TaxID=2488595 RepID=A0A3G8F583_9CAUD|nr:hypothetical protein QE332_gp018 [Pseudomonas phage vB_PaeM_LCK69]AZF89629.1 hypothetical protein [Pseudomonas phage vB_PaeM_LCK69]WQZ01301.1 hypothetical protein [Pseudomonas phage Pae01]
MEESKATFKDPYPRFFDASRRYGETNDCMVVSFAVVWNTTYEKAHQHLKVKCKRGYRQGATQKRFSYADTWCPKTRMLYREDAKDKTLRQFAEENPEGRFWIAVKGHAIAIIDGVLYDHTNDKRRTIWHCWQVWPGESPEKIERKPDPISPPVRKAPDWYV